MADPPPGDGADTEVTEVTTPHGPARRHLDRPTGPPVGLLVLGHGAGGGVRAPDLLAATAAARSLGWAVARLEQPYRVAGRRAPAPAAQLDLAWAAGVADVRSLVGQVPLVVGGRSSGARVAARSLAVTGGVGYLALAFPLVNPSGRSRQAELDGVDVPALILQGDRDPFGMPAAAPGRAVHVLTGADHGLRHRERAIRAAVGDWLAREFSPRGSRSGPASPR